MELITNRLPVKTWNKLQMNEVKLDIPDTGSPDITTLHISPDDAASQVLTYDFKNNGAYAGEAHIDVDSDVNHSIIMDFRSAQTGYANIKNIINLHNKSNFTLYQIFRLGDDYRFICDIKTDNSPGAVFELVQIFISGSEIYVQSESDLSGVGSKLKIDTAYLETDDHILDINYIANHIGENTVSDISVFGALCDKSEKRFRGTIDFKAGSIGSVGNEIERVLLLDDDVINKTIPIILCAEEDVEGNHGATIGKPDDDTLYYMKSRGLDEKTIREMMKTAYILALAHKLPDGEYKEDLLSELEKH